MSTTKFSSRPIFLFAGAVLLLGGCLDEAAFAPASPEPDDLPDVASAFSTEGLTLSASAPEQVAGTFERRGVSLRFELARDDQGRHLHVARASGEPLLDSTLADGIDTTVLLGGRARLTGAIDEAPAIEGDAAAFELMAAQPELALLPELKEALIARHVDERLYRASPDEASASKWSDGIWEHLAYGEQTGLWSWTFWGWTTVVIAREENPAQGFAAAWFKPNLAPIEYVSGYGMRYYRRQWAGDYVTIGNNLLPLCSVTGPWCQNTTMLVRHY